MKLYTAIALGVSTLSFSTGAAAVTCAVCPSSIFFQGLTRTLTTTREDTGNVIQCAYNSPAISGFSPACLYANVGGALTFTNTDGACPASTVVINAASCT